MTVPLSHWCSGGLVRHPRAHFPRARGCLLLVLALLAGIALSPVIARSLSKGPAALERFGRVVTAPAGSVRLGPVAPSLRITMDVVLVPRAGAALQELALAVSTPGSAKYRDYLSPSLLAKKFAPSRASISTVERALSARGLSGGVLRDGGLVVSYVTSASVLERVFSLSLSDYRVPGRSQVAYGSDRAPLVPSSIAKSVVFFAGLSSFDVALPEGAAAGDHAATLSSSGPVACAAAKATGGMTANSLAAAYHLSPLYAAGDLGGGVHVALFELEPFATADVTRYASCYGLHARLSVSAVDGGAGAGPGSGEAAADVESLLSIAPRSEIAVYEGPWSESGVIDTYSAIISASSRTRAAVLSSSWGVCEAELSPGLSASENTLFSEAAAEGMTVVAASGDHGSEDCATGWGSPSNSLSVADPAAQPFVTGVGGTTFAGSASTADERVWNVPGSSGGSGGGGSSRLFPEPSFQQQLLPGAGARLVPDVSAFASSQVGDAVVNNGQWSTYGGTSIAAPTWAGLFAIADSSARCRANGPVGFANPALYRLAAHHPGAHFNDITTGDNDYLGNHPGAYGATTGYDEASGLGSPVGQGLVNALCA